MADFADAPSSPLPPSAWRRDPLPSPPDEDDDETVNDPFPPQEAPTMPGRPTSSMRNAVAAVDGMIEHMKECTRKVGQSGKCPPPRKAIPSTP